MDCEDSREKRRASTRLEKLEEYGLCILFHLLLPFFPLVIEANVLGRVQAETLFLFVAMYTLSIGVSSISKLLFGATVVAALFFVSLFGLKVGRVPVPPLFSSVAYVVVTVVLIFHAGERFYRHVSKGESFWSFTGRR